MPCRSEGMVQVIRIGIEAWTSLSLLVPSIKPCCAACSPMHRSHTNTNAHTNSKHTNTELAAGSWPPASLLLPAADLAPRPPLPPTQHCHEAHVRKMILYMEMMMMVYDESSLMMMMLNCKIKRQIISWAPSLVLPIATCTGGTDRVGNRNIFIKRSAKQHKRGEAQNPQDSWTGNHEKRDNHQQWRCPLALGLAIMLRELGIGRFVGGIGGGNHQHQLPEKMIGLKVKHLDLHNHISWKGQLRELKFLHLFCLSFF